MSFDSIILAGLARTLFGLHRWGNYEWQTWWPDWWKVWQYKRTVQINSTYAHDRTVVEDFLVVVWIIQVRWKHARRY